MVSVILLAEINTGIFNTVFILVPGGISKPCDYISMILTDSDYLYCTIKGKMASEGYTHTCTPEGLQCRIIMYDCRCH